MLKDEVALYSKLTGKDGSSVPVGIIGAYLDGYEMGKSDAQPEPNWVPCSERLPEEQGLYLVTELEFERIEIDIRYFNIDGDNKFWSGWGDDPVLAWMPLTAPYKEDAQCQTKPTTPASANSLIIARQSSVRGLCVTTTTITTIA